MLARSSASSLGAEANHASRSRPALLPRVIRRLIASTLASFQRRAPPAVRASHTAPRGCRRPCSRRSRPRCRSSSRRWPVGAPIGDVARRSLATPGPVVALPGGQRAVRERLVAAFADLIDQGVGDSGPFVGGDGDALLRGRLPGLSADQHREAMVLEQAVGVGEPGVAQPAQERLDRQQRSASIRSTGACPLVAGARAPASAPDGGAARRRRRPSQGVGPSTCSALTKTPPRAARRGRGPAAAPAASGSRWWIASADTIAHQRPGEAARRSRHQVVALLPQRARASSSIAGAPSSRVSSGAWGARRHALGSRPVPRAQIEDRASDGPAGRLERVHGVA